MHSHTHTHSLTELLENSHQTSQIGNSLPLPPAQKGEKGGEKKVFIILCVMFFIV